MIDPLAHALSQLTPVLNRLGIHYVVVGGLASAARGIYRTTFDGDLLAIIAPLAAPSLVAALGKDWYADADMMERSIRASRSFNVIHIPTAQKIDIFPATDDFHASQIERATLATVFPTETDLQLPVASVEDIVLAKLKWYREGGEVSEKQWNDIGGVLATNPNLDMNYLRPWAARLRVTDLLDKALAEVASEL